MQKFDGEFLNKIPEPKATNIEAQYMRRFLDLLDENDPSIALEQFRRIAGSAKVHRPEFTEADSGAINSVLRWIQLLSDRMTEKGQLSAEEWNFLKQVEGEVESCDSQLDEMKKIYDELSSLRKS